MIGSSDAVFLKSRNRPTSDGRDLQAATCKLTTKMTHVTLRPGRPPQPITDTDPALGLIRLLPRQAVKPTSRAATGIGS